MNRLTDALEACLQSIAAGQSPEAAVARFPDLKAELQPLVEAAMAARAAAVPDMPAEVKRRGRARFLQRAAQIREGRVVGRRRIIPAWPRVAITLGIVGILVLTSTRLVSASSGAIPGDQLYGIKRSWEGLQLFFVAQPQEHYLLESQFEQERLDEIDELLAKGKAEAISFSGIVMQQSDGSWLVSGIPVAVTASTRLSSDAIANSAPVTIAGVTRNDGVVQAIQVQLLGPGVALPPLEPSEQQEEATKDEHEDSGSTPGIAATPPAGSPSRPASEDRQPHEFTGVVQSLGVNEWRINGQTVYVQGATIMGTVKVGTEVKFEGYYGADGRFVVTQLQVTSNITHNDNKGGEGSDGSSDSGSDDGSEDSSGD